MGTMSTNSLTNVASRAMSGLMSCRHVRVPCAISTALHFRVKAAPRRCDGNLLKPKYASNSTARGRPWCVTVRGAKGAAGYKASKQRYVCEDCGEDYSQWYGQCPGCKAWESFKIFNVEHPAGPTSGGGGAGARALARAAADAPSELDVRSRDDPALNFSSKQTPLRSKAGGKLRRSGWVADAGTPRRLSDVLSPTAQSQRLPRVRLQGSVGAEVERVLGGGVVPGGLVLVGGDPGVGKSTLVLQIAGLLGEQSSNTLSETDQSDEDEGAPFTHHSPVLYASGEESIEQLASRAERLGVNTEVRFAPSCSSQTIPQNCVF